ncbi:MAG: hypothetical protein ACTHMX_14020, partial [Thermomicrobiales bacterium]
MTPVAPADLFGLDIGLLFARPMLLLAVPLAPLLVWGLARLLRRRSGAAPTTSSTTTSANAPSISRTAIVLRSLVLALLLLGLAGPMLAHESTRVT